MGSKRELSTPKEWLVKNPIIFTNHCRNSKLVLGSNTAGGNIMENLFDIKELLSDGFESLERSIFKYICDVGRELTIHILEQLDEYLMKNRDKKRYKSKDIRKTTIKTVYGEVEYKRRLYIDTDSKKCVYLLDDELQMEKVGTISTNLAKKIANAAIDMSYRKAADNISETTGQSISSHGIWNAVQSIGTDIQKEEAQLVKELKTENARGESETRILFQEADGVYINIQENKQKAKSQEIKLATIYTGWEKDGTKLHEKTVYAGLENSKQFNEKTEALIQSIYNIDETEVRILNGDGAAWIKNTYEPDRIFQLDRFHIKQEIRRCIQDKKTANRIICKFNNLDMNGMLNDIETYINSIDDGSNGNKIKMANNLYNYLNNNYDGLMPWQKQVNKLPEAPSGVVYKNMGVQENQNCSLVTMRMKGRKMRWSVSGANNMVKLIYMRENGELDRIIEERDGQLTLPSDFYIKDVLSSIKVKEKVGKGSKYVEVFNTSMPLLSCPNKPYYKILRNIKNQC